MKKLKFKIDYDNPEKYLSQGEQTRFIFTDKELKTVKNEIGEIKTSKDLFKIINFMYKNRQHNPRQNDDRKFRRTAKEIFENKEYTGCTDYAIVFATIARQLGLATVCVEAADLDWISETKQGINKGARGHHTCEVFINGKWVHADPAANSVFDIYDKDNEIITYSKGEQRQVFWKGIDLFEVGIKTTKDMVDTMRNLVLETVLQEVMLQEHSH